MRVPVTYLVVAIGGAIGAALRHSVNQLALSLFGSAFAYGTLIANLSGAFFMGVAAHYLLGNDIGTGSLRLFLVTGVLGGFTTFSAFTFEVGILWQRGDHGAAGLYVTASLLLSVLLLFAGMFAARAIS